MTSSDPILRRIRIPLITKATSPGPMAGPRAFVIDIKAVRGLRGAFRALPSGEEVGIRFSCRATRSPSSPVPGGVVASAGRAARVESLPSGVGLEFVTVSEHDRDRVRTHLLDYLRSHLGPRRFHRQRLGGGEEP